MNTPGSWDDLIACCGLPRLEARMLAELASGQRREWLIAHGDELATAAATTHFMDLVARRRSGQAMAYLLGWREFRSRRFEVTPDVLVPRPETETLVDIVLAAIATDPALATRPLRMLDLGTGSGVIAISLALECPDAEVWATDRSTSALALAQRNATALGATVQWRAGNWFDALPDAAPAWDVLVSNPPYIAANDPHLLQGDLPSEPRMALTDEADGLSALAIIIAGAARRLRPQGLLVVEHGYDQGQDVRNLLQAAGFSAHTAQDLHGLDRFGVGRLQRSAAGTDTMQDCTAS